MSKKWELSEEENPYPSIKSGLPTDDFCYSQYDLSRAFKEGARAQKEKMVECLEADGKNSWYSSSCGHPVLCIKKTFWQRLRKKVGPK